MSYRARQRSENKRAGGLKGRDRGWLPGSSQSNSIGIPHNLVHKTRERTNTLVTREAAANIAGGQLTEPLPDDYGKGDILIDTRSLVVNTNQLGGIGRFRSQFNVDADGIKHARYYLPIYPKNYFRESIGDCNTICEKARPNSVIQIGRDIPSSSSGFQTLAQLKQAVNLWFSDQTQAIAQYGDISTWDVSLIRDMSSLFMGTTLGDTTTGDITSWDTSNVTSMAGMFNGAQQFNQPINTSGNHWKTSNVTDMSEMFAEAQQFNRDISNWDTTSVQDMSAMFYGAQQFNQNISSWDTSNVTDMSYMFYGALGMNGQDWSSSTPGVTNWINTLNTIAGSPGGVVSNFYYDTSSVSTDYVYGQSTPSGAYPILAV
jgi:surface protein